MKIQISNRHDSANTTIKGFIEAGLSSLAEKYEIMGADVVLDQEGRTNKQYSAEIILHVKGSQIHTKEKSEEIGKSVDLAMKTLEKQLQKHKETHYSSHEIRRHTITK
jgi:ribosomal subunit interface protein